MKPEFFNQQLTALSYAELAAVQTGEIWRVFRFPAIKKLRPHEKFYSTNELLPERYIKRVRAELIFSTENE